MCRKAEFVEKHRDNAHSDISVGNLMRELYLPELESTFYRIWGGAWIGPDWMFQGGRILGGGCLDRA